MSTSLTPEEVNDFLAEVFPSSYADGTRCVELGDRTAVARWPYDDTELRPGGYISGPRMFALADSALWFASFTVIGLEAMAVTSELSIRFLRPARNGDLVGRAVLNSVSTRRIVGTVEIWVDGAPDRLVAAAQGSYARP
ncbi:MAG TPA: PaaI family thioesterase [Acidimicrobiia bacterium]